MLPRTPHGERVPLTILTPYGEKLKTPLKPKSMNRARLMIRAHGAANVALVLTGQLDGV